MVSARQTILGDLQSALETIPGFEQVYYWHDLDLQFEKDALEFRDTSEEVQKKNIPYEKSLTVLICALCFTEDILAVSSRVLRDIEKCVDAFRVNNGKLLIKNNTKTVETKGKKGVKIIVRVEINYREEL